MSLEKLSKSKFVALSISEKLKVNGGVLVMTGKGNDKPIVKEIWKDGVYIGYESTTRSWTSDERDDETGYRCEEGITYDTVFTRV